MRFLQGFPSCLTIESNFDSKEFELESTAEKLAQRNVVFDDQDTGGI